MKKYKSTMNYPLISIILPAHNGELYIAEAIQSILNQNYKNFEILVIDNGSTDNTADVVRTFNQVNYFSLPIANTAKARNEGVKHAQGEFISFLDQDDLWSENKLQQQITYLQCNPECQGVIGMQKIYLQQGCEKPDWLKREFLEQPQLGYLPSALMVRRKIFTDIHLFDEQFSFASDVDWFFKIKQLNIHLDVINDILVYRRIHQNNASNKIKELHKEYLQVIRNTLQTNRMRN